MAEVKTLEYPLGRDVNTLILCRDEQHMRDMIEALQIKARYMCACPTIGGRTYARIIVFDRKWNNVEDLYKWAEYVSYLHTMLNLEGKLYLI